MLRLAFDFIITWRETRTRPNAYTSCYWGGNAERGEFRNFGGTVDATKVDGATVKWQTAVDGMNIALTDNDYQWALGTNGLPVMQKKQ